MVHDPASYVQAVKQRLHEKAGIPPLQQRLIFKAPPASQPAEPDTCARSGATCSAPNHTIGESHTWQVCLNRRLLLLNALPPSARPHWLAKTAHILENVLAKKSCDGKHF